MAWPEKLRRVPWELAAIFLLAAALRLVALDLKAPHFDEGVNGWFADRLRETGSFEYTPDNFHGPWHFYTVFVSQSLLGRNVWALRLPVVLASLLTMAVLLLYRRWFAPAAVRWAALGFAVSPACVFYGRYSIHEPWFVLFTALFTWGAIALWLDRDRAGLWAAVLGLAGMILNKETYVIHAGSLALAGVVLAAWGRVVPLNPPIARRAQREWHPRDLRNATIVAVLLLAFFYSGNFFHPAGLLGPFKAMIAWTKTGAAGHGHEKTAFELLPFVNYYWLALLARYEWPALVGLLWSVRYAWPAPAVPRLLAILGGGVLLAYSLVPYKTPWCLSAMIWPWFLFFGAAVTATPNRWTRAVGALLLAASLGMTLRLNFREYENDAEPYVYVQTYRSVEKLTGPLLELARQDPRHYGISGAIYLQSSYPLPWILGDFTNIGYHDGKIPDPLPQVQFHVIETARVEELRPKLGPGFEAIPFHLRSGLDECTVFFQAGLLPGSSQPSAEGGTPP